MVVSESVVVAAAAAADLVAVAAAFAVDLAVRVSRIYNDDRMF